VKIVNTNTLKFKDLPFQTQKYFEELALKSKTSVEEEMSKDKGKLLLLVDKEGKQVEIDGNPVLSNFPDGKLVEDDITREKIQEARKNNSTFTISKVSNYPVEITEDTNFLGVATGNNPVSIKKELMDFLLPF